MKKYITTQNFILAILFIFTSNITNAQTICQCASGENSILLNGSFEETTHPNYSLTYDLIQALGKNNSGVKFLDRHTEDHFPGWFTTGGIALQQGGFSQGGTIEVGQSGFLGYESPDGTVYAEMDGNHHNQIVAVTSGQLLDWELSHRGREGVDEISVSAGPVGNQTVIANLSSPNTAWITHTGQYLVPDGVTEIQFTITPTTASNGDIDSSNLLDKVNLCPNKTCDNPQNIALGKSVTQSNTWANNTNGYGAANAIDGNNNGVHTTGSISHTLNRQNSWWEIDLGTIYDLSSVKIWNRTDCCASRLSDFHVLVSDTPFNSQTLSNTLSQSGVGNFHFEGTAGRETDINLNQTGRYLRIQLAGKNALQLAEVEIMGCSKAVASFYKHCRYNGTSISLGVGEYPNIAAMGLGNDQLSSLKVPTGLKVTLYKNSNFNGGSITFTADDICLINNSFNDVCTSLKVEETNSALQRVAFSSELHISKDFGNKTNLKWYFLRDENRIVDQFIIKHSTDELEELRTVQILDASDLIGVEQYNFIHRNPVEGKNNYQILAQYEDGTVDYSMHGDISFDEISQPISIAPNPTSGNLKVDLSNYMDQSVHYTINSIHGREVLNGSHAFNHNDIVEIDLANISNGIYIIYIEPKGELGTAIKFVVAKDY